MARERAGALGSWDRQTSLPGAFLSFWDGIVRWRNGLPAAARAGGGMRNGNHPANETEASNSALTPAADLTVAVVICTRDRPRALLETLDSIWSQSRRPDELIIIDDGNLSDRVIEEMAIRCRSLSIKWRYRHTDLPGLTRGRNLAADMAESEVLQYLDDDVTCAPTFLAEIDRIMRDRSVAGVTATVWEPAFSTPSARLYQLGYRLAGWWRIGPRQKPSTPPPAVLRHPDEAVPARWLSGAAMAIRREIVRTWRFDEQLTQYALGEDREFGYRLAPHFWLVESKRACVVHRRETSQRTDSRRLGFMTSYNYLRILHKTCRLRIGDWLLIVWSLTTLAAMHSAWMLLGGRRAHFDELRGMFEGVWAFLRRLPKPSSPDAQGQHGDQKAAIRTKSFAPPVETPLLRQTTRIVFVTTTLEPGGAELMLLSLVKQLPRHGIQPHVLCLKDPGPLADQCRESGTPVFANLLKFKADAAVIPRIHRILKDHCIDVVVAAHSGGDRMFWATLAAKTAGLPIVVWSHWFPTPANRHFEPANRALLHCIDAFVALGERHRLALIRDAYVPAGRIAVIPNAIELDRFTRGPSRTEARRRLNLADEHIAVAIIANLRPEKRHDVFIQAARRLAAGNPNYRFLVIGDGPNHQAVWSAAAASGLLPDRLQLLGRRNDVHELLPGLDICCLCSDVECFSVTMLEAAAAGCVFIGPDAGAIPEHLQHRHTGLLIKPADVASLTDAIAELAADPQLRHRLAEAARQDVEHRYGIDRTAGSFAGLLSAVAACKCGIAASVG
jgi:glycosyltransferase involved in cell wall biosynthesis/GT2 family glycosyltransferase